VHPAKIGLVPGAIRVARAGVGNEMIADREVTAPVDRPEKMRVVESLVDAIRGDADSSGVPNATEQCCDHSAEDFHIRVLVC
jgi:hypothetical protein